MFDPPTTMYTHVRGIRVKIPSTNCKAKDDRGRIFDFCLHTRRTVYQINVKGNLRGNHE